MKLRIFLILAGLLFLFQGCGMMGGHLVHGINHVSHQKPDKSGTVIRELRQDRYRIEMIVPAMTAGNQCRILVTVWDEYLDQFVTGVTVFVYAQYVPDELFVPTNSELEYDYKYQTDEIEAGAYEARLIPDEVGNLAIRAEIELTEPQGEPIKIDMVQEVFPAENRQNQPNRITPWAILGGIGMGIIMVFMLGWDMH